jgi:cyclase
MFRPRVIPVLLLKDQLLYKTRKFKQPKYVGDPRVALKIFNDKGADEIAVLDIMATIERRRPDFELLEEIADECFMPMAYGGGVADLEDIRRLIRIGVEKVIVSTHAIEEANFVSAMAEEIGSQSTVVCMDVKKGFWGGEHVMTHGGRCRTKWDPIELAQRMAEAGAGEIIVHSIDRDGTFDGYDLPLIQRVSEAVEIPVIALGGAGREEDFVAAVEHGASAVAAGSLFVFQGPHRAVLITYPDDKKLQTLFDRSSAMVAWC